MKKLKVKYTYRTFKIGKDKFSARAFHPLRFVRGAYAVDVHQIGTPWRWHNEYTYFTQVMARSGADAIKKVRKQLLQKYIAWKAYRQDPNEPLYIGNFRS